MEKRQVIIVKADGEKEPFQREKLIESLRRVNTSAAIIERVVRHVETDIADGMSTSDIYRHAFSLLRKMEDHHAVVRYSLRRALVGLGPTGFPFEDYVGAVFRAHGYNVEVGKVVQGKCVPHEVDLIAHNDKKLIMGEIKFHNELGYKSDLKVALYVKARMDDLRASKFFYGGKMRTLDDGLLLTNTKFTQTALDYANCSGLTMIGWNYPPHGQSLQDMIESKGLHPISCLTSLSARNRNELFKKGIVLCRSLLDDPELLTSIGVHDLQREEILNEVTALFAK